ncbi:MAG: hypothetical protein EP335_13290 [Alphaproteobacteria bacterium]|nr:MAG: hypothetical protein EP335_13290 [Alphaproteobacteria bacterium]
MADASFAMRSHGSAPAIRNDRSTARSSGSVSARSADGAAFAREFGSTRGDSSAGYQQAPDLPAGKGLLSTGVQLLLAETRTQEADARFPAPGNLGRARSAYLDVAARVRDTIAANRLTLAEAPAPAAPSGGTSANALSSEPGFTESGTLDFDLE